MVLILGAAYAGKRDIARKFYHVETFCSGADDAFSDICGATAISDYHLLIRRLLQSGESPEAFTEALLQANPDAVILMNEVGAGIIPLEREERRWRESCGICSRKIAEKSDTVIRVICGIPTVLKGELP